MGGRVMINYFSLFSIVSFFIFYLLVVFLLIFHFMLSVCSTFLSLYAVPLQIEQHAAKRKKKKKLAR